MKIFSASICRAVGLLWVLLVLVMVPQLGQGSCVPSSCGKISNISHPFRRKDDPPSCGDSRYEIECVNDVAVLRLSSDSEAEYQVQAINYNNYTIRLVDPNIQEDNCSSIPGHFLYRYNFSDVFTDWYGDDSNYHADVVVDLYQATQYRNTSSYGIGSIPLFTDIIYMSCNTTVSREDDNNNSTSCLDLHKYVVVGNIKGRRWRPGCHVKLIGATSGLFQLQQLYDDYRYRARWRWAWGDDQLSNGDDRTSNISYSDIHRALSYGFELSWLHATCREHKCGSRPCYFDEPTRNVLCSSPICDTTQHSIPGCGFRRVIRSYFNDFLGIAHDFLYGMYTLIRFRGKNKIDASLLDHYYTAIEGWYALLSYMAARVLFGVALLVVLLIYKWRRRHLSEYVNIENFLQDNNLTPIRYSYREIKRMTKNFKVKLGQGGFGFVYKGKLRSGPDVAIKVLKQSKANGQEFINEVATIGRIHHVNVVRLIGFCVEGSKRALVYEFMSNGSLDKYIFTKEGDTQLSYEIIYEIALGVACGISYLHRGCDMQILHFDIKPHNILLDENFIPKVSDFGLARLYPIDHSIVTLTDKKGTIGYIAPELFYNNLGGISYKADVYSFGMLLMEMASRQKKVNPKAENSSQIFFPTWIYDQFSKGKEVELDNCTENEKSIAKKMIITALWCIQLKPSDRPSMNRVVQMLEGEIEDLTIPTKPLLYPNETVSLDDNQSFEQITSDYSTNATSESN